MLKRGPRQRLKADKLYPKVLSETVEELRVHIRQRAIESPGIDPQVAARRLADVDVIEKKFQEERPPGLIEEIKRPWASGEMLDAIHRMVWRVMESHGSQSFITSDNPVFLFEGYGLKRREAELVAPEKVILKSDPVLDGRS